MKNLKPLISNLKYFAFFCAVCVSSFLVAIDAGAAAASSQNEASLISDSEQHADEDQYLQKLDEITAESPIEEEEITYDVPVVVNDKVELFIKYFQTRGRKYFEKWLTRSEMYFPMLKDIFGQNGLPEDLTYLALIESGF